MITNDMDLQITSRDAALEIADENCGIQAKPIIDMIEGKIKTWMGPPTPIIAWFDKDKISPNTIKIICQLYSDQGWSTASGESWIKIR